MSPLSAATAAAWLTEDGFEVDWDWTMPMPRISSFGPPANPIRQPVIA